MSLSDKIFSFVYNTQSQHLPKEALQRAKHCFLDALGVIVAGHQHRASQLILDYVKNLGGRQDATALVSGYKTSAPLAGLINGTTGHILDFDDTNFELEGHPSVVLIPAIMAAGEKVGASGLDLLIAYVLGFEAACKIGKGVNPGHYRRGYHATSTIGVFGATIAAGKILRLSPSELGNAWGIAGSRSSGLRANFGTMTKALHAGLAAHDAVMAVFLGKSGFTANSRILETDLGFGQVMSSEFDFETSFNNLGNPLSIISSGVAFKKYPSGALTHPAVDATLGLLQENQINPAQIKKIKCGTNEELFKILIHPHPSNGLEAKFSLPYCLARACLDGKLEMDDFTDEKVRDPRVQGIMRRVIHYVDPENGWGQKRFGASSKVTIELESGQIYEKSVEGAKGTPGNPLSFEELANKFRACVKDILTYEQIERVVYHINEMEKVKDVSEIVKLLISGGKES